MAARTRLETEALEGCRAAARRLGPRPLRQCRACLPLPPAVPIRTAAPAQTWRSAMDMEAFATERYNLIGRAGHVGTAVDAQACEALRRLPAPLSHGLAIP